MKSILTWLIVLNLTMGAMSLGCQAAPEYSTALNEIEDARPEESHQASDNRSLSDAQRQAIKSIDDQAQKKAAPVVARLAGIVKRIYENMLAEKPDEELRISLGNEMKEATWELLSIKGQSIREIVSVLTPGQKQLVKSEMERPGAPADLAEVIDRVFKTPAK